MVRLSTAARAASNGDYASPLERLQDSPFLLGLFLPIQSGGWTPSTAPRGTTWAFDYNAELTVRAEELGFDLVFGLAQWLGKGGYGGKVQYREQAIDPLIVTAGLASLTTNIVLISTVHILYGWHPLHIAKFGATLDHMTGGRWGINVVTGYRETEYQMFGMQQIEHDLRYDMAEEFTTLMKQLWSKDANVTHEGRYWGMIDAFVSPKPVHGRPIIVNAAASDAGLRYAAKHSDLIFITSPGGANFDKAIETLPALNKRIKELGAEFGKQIKTIINPHIIARETEKEVEQILRLIIDNEDAEAVDGVMGSFMSGDQKAWKGHKRNERIIGGNIQLFGTPEQIVDYCVQLKKAGCDGIQINFFDYVPDLEFFGTEIMPLMRQADLRR